jgi:hypothetical protein
MAALRTSEIGAALVPLLRLLTLFVVIDLRKMCTFCYRNFYKITPQTFTNILTVRNFEVISGKFNVVDICTSGNDADKWITKWNTC